MLFANRKISETGAACGNQVGEQSRVPDCCFTTLTL